MNKDHDTIVPFQLESSNLRGRILKLDTVLERILAPHNYPPAVSQLVGEVATMALLLSSMLKYEGIFTLQAQGDGPVGLLLADVTTAGDVRACASFNRERLEQAGGDGLPLLGKGYMAFTVDQGARTERYQGIVELKGQTLVDCVQHYFAQSEQIRTGIKMAVGRRGESWVSSAILLQNLPENGGWMQEYESAAVTAEDSDDWQRAMILLGSCTEAELLDPALRPHDLLIRLFHEEGVRVYEAGRITKGCRCSMERLEGILKTMPAHDRRDMVVDGAITMHCEFCSRDFAFDPAEIERKISE